MLNKAQRWGKKKCLAEYIISEKMFKDRKNTRHKVVGLNGMGIQSIKKHMEQEKHEVRENLEK